MLCSLSCHSQTRLSSNAALGLRLMPAETRARCGYDEDTTQLRSCSVLLRSDQAMEEGEIFTSYNGQRSSFVSLRATFPVEFRGCLITRLS
jgi:hypothetical protein